jgi:DNA polymerase III delta prime subunit
MSINSFHLNQFYNNITRHYDNFSLAVLESLHLKLVSNETRLYDLPHLLFYGQDTSLCKAYIYQVLRWGLHYEGDILLKNNTFTINNIDVQYSNTENFIQINFETHLNKEKNALIDFIKQVVSQRNVLHSKHIFILWNIEKITHQGQYRLRRIIEKNQEYSLFISFISQYTKLIDPLKSRFLMIRVPCLKSSQKNNIFTSLFQEHNEAIHENKRKSLESTNILKKIDNYCTNLEDIYIYFKSYIIHNDPDIFIKDIKIFNFVDNEINILLKGFNKIKNAYELLDITRTFIYKIIHYNIDHSITAKSIFKALLKLKLSDEKLKSATNILAKFEHSTLFISVCKLVYAYEYLLIELYKIIHHEQD